LKVGGSEDENVVTVARVGTGFSMEQLRDIRERIRPHLRRYDAHRAPAWLGGWRGAGKSKPDAILESPRHGFVMEVRAAELVPSDEYSFGHTLRFPRAVTAIRTDKDWCDAATEVDLRDFIQGGRSQLTLRRVRPKVEVHSDGEDDTDEGDQHSRAKRRKGGKGGAGKGCGSGLLSVRTGGGLRRSHSFGVLDGFREADTTHVPVASQLLHGAEVFVLNGDAQYSKADLEAYVVRHGGRNVQNYIRGRTSIVVAASMGDLRAKNLAKTAHVDIVMYSYLFQCECAGRMLALQPRHLLSVSPEMQERFAAAFDKWGDAFYELVTSESLRETLDAIHPAATEEVPEELVEALSKHPRFTPPLGADGQPPPWVAARVCRSEPARSAVLAP